MQTERDLEIVGWVGRLGAAGAEHVMERFGMGRSWCYERLGPLVAEGLLAQRVLLHRQPGLYLATAEGLRWAGLERLGVYRLSPGRFQHAREVATAAVALHKVLPDWRLRSEREIRVEEQPGGLAASAKVGELQGQPILHRPDLAVVSPDGRVVVVEVELSIKTPRRLEAICRGYARARHIDHTFYLALPGPAKAVEKAVKATRSEDRITVVPLGEPQALAVVEGEGVGDARA